MLNTTPEMRPDAHQFSKISYFEDIGVKTLAYLDSLLQWDNLQKSQFYRGLPEALGKLPQRVKLQQVLPCLVRDLAQPAMVPFLLPSILDIAQECSQKEYVSQILPHLKPVMKLTNPIQILLIFLQRMELLLKLTPAEDIQQHVLPMFHRGLDSDNPQIHQMCLSVLPTFAGLLDHANVKNSVLPRIKRLCISTPSTPVRVSCLICIGQLLEHLDKWLVLDEIIPFLPQVPSREPAVLMGILGILKLALNHKKLGISKEIIATRILPFLIPLSIENGLTLAQFNALVALIKQMFQMVETEHRTKLEQLNTVDEQQKVLESQLPSIVPLTSKPVEIDKAFSGLGLDDIMSNSLSLEDKQKLAKQEETIKVLQTQPQIQPTPISQTMRPPSQQTTKDLTSSLSNLDTKMWNNMNLLAHSVKSNTPPSNNFGISPLPIMGSPISNPAHSNNLMQTSSLQNQPNFNQNLWNNNGLTAASSYNNQLALQGPPMMTNMNNSNQWTTSSQNLNQNWRQPNTNGSNNKLSNDDLMDLLS
ncbi:SCY1-like protein 2 [Agrilus planipennis]|uniref:SCY1-like protein 2 n=1 Tax=Agrilus planipennis TaxID=224129 RepID=A0A1W4WH35_AGRPL|nr:SCY1-like protein 2 [Agrilus planipennis]